MNINANRTTLLFLEIWMKENESKWIIRHRATLNIANNRMTKPASKSAPL